MVADPIFPKCACLEDWFSIPITYITVGEYFLMAAMAIWMFLFHIQFKISGIDRQTLIACYILRT